MFVIQKREDWLLLAGGLSVIGTWLLFQRFTREWRRAAPILVITLAIASIVYLITFGIWVLVYIEGIYVFR